MSHAKRLTEVAQRFRDFLPIVVDVETSGLNPAAHAILEIAMVSIGMNENGQLIPSERYACQVEPFWQAAIDPEALQVNRINLNTPLRYALTEKQALHNIFSRVKKLLRQANAQRALLVGHNAWFDLQFIMAAAKRNRFYYTPFHTFTSLDTASLSAVGLGETVLAKAAKKAGISFDVDQAHSGIYDADRTAELFCYLCNRFQFNK